MGELQLLLLVRLLDELADLIIGLIHSALLNLTLLLRYILFDFIVGHGNIEPVLLLLHVPPPDTPLLQFLVHLVRLFVLQVQHLLVYQHAINGTPVAGGIGGGIIETLDSQIVTLAALWELNLNDLENLICAALVIRYIIEGGLLTLRG